MTMIDKATGRMLARFSPAGTVESHGDLLERWLQKFGRPLVMDTERQSIFEAHEVDCGIGRSRKTKNKPPSEWKRSGKAAGPHKPAADHPWRTGQSR
jgi:hypothetical protein